jgi:hypothetical protein
MYAEILSCISCVVNTPTFGAYVCRFSSVMILSIISAVLRVKHSANPMPVVMDKVAVDGLERRSQASIFSVAIHDITRIVLGMADISRCMLLNLL